jgi:hypothetical protein
VLGILQIHEGCCGADDSITSLWRTPLRLAIFNAVTKHNTTLARRSSSGNRTPTSSTPGPSPRTLWQWMSTTTVSVRWHTAQRPITSYRRLNVPVGLLARKTYHHLEEVVDFIVPQAEGLELIDLALKKMRPGSAFPRWGRGSIRVSPGGWKVSMSMRCRNGIFFGDQPILVPNWLVTAVHTRFN